MKWQTGRELAKVTLKNGTVVSYAYNTNGMRTCKNVGGTKTYYYYDDNNNLVGLTKGNITMFFYYDSDNSPVSMSYNGTMYYYVKNLQGDIVKIINKNGTVYGTYTYDAWGNVKKPYGDPFVSELNPLRYRGYVYDTDTGLYYLQSRYYDPFVGRFLNADDTNVLRLSDSEILSTNIYTYCGNNPISNSDLEGNWGLPTPAKIIAGAVIGGLLSAVIEVVIQTLIFRTPLNKVNWWSVGIEFVSGALVGGLIACNLPAGYTTLGRGIISMLSSLAHSIRQGKFKTIKGAVSSIGSAVISGAATIIIGRVMQKYGRTLNYKTVKQMLRKIAVNRLIRTPIRISWGFIRIVIN